MVCPQTIPQAKASLFVVLGEAVWVLAFERERGEIHCLRLVSTMLLKLNHLDSMVNHRFLGHITTVSDFVLLRWG